MDYFVYLKCENKHTIHTMTKVLYKSYTQNDYFLFPPCIVDFIPENHPVRTVNAILDNFDISEIESTYKGGGTTSYHPRMLLKIVVYAYLTNIYSGRRMASLLEENVFFMWLSGMSRRTSGQSTASEARDLLTDASSLSSIRLSSYFMTKDSYLWMCSI